MSVRLRKKTRAAANKASMKAIMKNSCNTEETRSDRTVCRDHKPLISMLREVLTTHRWLQGIRDYLKNDLLS